MNTDAQTTNGNGETRKASGKELLYRPADKEITVGLKSINDIEGLALGFRQGMIDLSTDDETVGTLSCGAGVGTDWIILEWGGKQAAIRGADLLKAYVMMVDPGEAKHIPMTSKETPEFIPDPATIIAEA